MIQILKRVKFLKFLSIVLVYQSVNDKIQANLENHKTIIKCLPTANFAVLLQRNGDL